MKLSLGLYTELYSAPASLFEKTLALVYEPVLSYMYNNPGHKLSFYQSSQMMKYIQRERPEYRSLIATLSKRGDIEPLSGSWSQALLSLLPPKDRVAQIERLTSSIRHEYGILPSSAFLYGQVWQPIYVSLLKNAGIDNVVIATSYEGGPKGTDTPFVMNELGRKEKIYPICRKASIAVSQYSKGEFDYSTLKNKIFQIVRESDDDLTLFLNMDQLVLGAQRNGNQEKPGMLVIDLLSSFDSCTLSELPVTRAGYLPQGWYGYDGETFSFPAFNELLVYNDNYRYLYNRYITLAEGSQTRNNRFLKKDVATALFNVATGPLFINDSQFAPLRYRTRQNFWSSIVGAENCFWEYTDGPSSREYDWEDIGRADVVMSNRSYLAVVSPKGASSPEFDYLPKAINLFDTRPPFNRNIPAFPLLKSFCDTIRADGKEWNTDDYFFACDILDKKRSEVQFLLEDPSLPFIISKRYKMRASTFILDILLTNTSQSLLKGSYSVSVYLPQPDFLLLGHDHRMDMVAKGSVQSKTVKYGKRGEEDLLVIFTGTTSFTLREEERKEVEITALGEEEFGLWKKIDFCFPLAIDSGESVTYRLIMRVGGQKKD